MKASVAAKRAAPLERESAPPAKRAASSLSSSNWQQDIILAIAAKRAARPRPRRSYAEGVMLMAQEFLDDRLMPCDSPDDNKGDELDENDDTPLSLIFQGVNPEDGKLHHPEAQDGETKHGKAKVGETRDSETKDGKPSDPNSKNSNLRTRQISPDDFKIPRLRRCPFDINTMTIIGPVHPHKYRQVVHYPSKNTPDIDGGFDGYNWKVCFGDRGPFVLKVFWDQEPPEPWYYYALQRECQNVAVLQMMQAAFRLTDDVGPVIVQPHPSTWDVALNNMLAFSNEHRQRNAQAIAADAAFLDHKRQLTWMPRIRRCYGWTRITGTRLDKELPPEWHPRPVTLNHKLRELQRDLTYTALIYEYIPEAPNDEAALADSLAFFRDAGFAHTLTSLARNWKGNVLIDMSDLVAACGWNWDRWRLIPECILRAI
ncbi:hypothetical protein CCM_08068 [Cordyceps militaris CM01]|uniref:Uncharacterized protein n=2 Tax=Cordyceps militaris TaxID=73501 RepID=G3JNH5_CORMM|nr:uncharacterized protein CCM_08068 [Cordyceps militaris CM01]ATY62558.1 hypothetical protein A9K55_006961 [Cordyceps militaris]EGX89815.1 hypothetical protein CCM_08068 [Cordyceps militaris CM01]